MTSSCLNDDLGKDDSGDSKKTPLPLEITAKAPERSGSVPGASAAVKTMTPDGAKVYWEPGDQVAVYPGAASEAERYHSVVYNADIDEAQPVATFVRDFYEWNYEEEDFYYAAYPLASVDRWGSIGNHTCYFQPPVQQTARVGGWDSNSGCLVAMSRTSEFFFEHALAYVKFSVDAGTSPFVSVQVAVSDVANTIGSFN